MTALLLCLSLSVGDAEPAAWPETETDTAPGPRRVARVTAGSDWLTLSVQSDVSELSLEYRPNSQLVWGALVGIGPFTVSGWIAGGALEDTTFFGETRALDLAAAYSLKLGENELNLFGEYRRYSGFYLENSGELGGSDEFPLVRSDISSSALTFSGTYFFDPSFSYSRAFYDAAHDRETTGSWVLRVTTGYVGFGARTPLVPPGLSGSFGRSAFVRGSDTVLLAASGGYAQDWVWPSGFFFTGMILGGWNIGYRLTTEGADTGFSNAPSASVATTTGWTGERYSGGLVAEAILDGVSFDDMDVGVGRYNVTFYFSLKL